MTFVVRWLAVLGLVAVVAGSCSIHHRSGDFTCDEQAGCGDGRTCVGGLCVVAQLDSGVTPVDAPPTADAMTCPSQCTSCNAGTMTCTIDCALSGGACNQAITCPAGWNCNIACSPGNSCRNGINCQNSKSCTITCSGQQACRDVTCGTGPCNIDCTGDSSCREISCGASCACDVTCRLGSRCTELTCRAQPDCRATSPSGGCSSLGTGCNTCPVAVP